jgi:hypothetical protein
VGSGRGGPGYRRDLSGRPIPSAEYLSLGRDVAVAGKAVVVSWLAGTGTPDFPKETTGERERG